MSPSDLHSETSTQIAVASLERLVLFARRLRASKLTGDQAFSDFDCWLDALGGLDAAHLTLILASEDRQVEMVRELQQWWRAAAEELRMAINIATGSDRH